MSEVRSALAQFTASLAVRHGLDFPDYRSLHQWSCDNPSLFWGTLLQFSNIPFSGSDTPVLHGSSFTDRKFFPNLKLNYTRCLLQHAETAAAETVAITVVSEAGGVATATWADLKQQVLCMAATLQAHGVEAGDRVVAVAGNSVESIIACLATTAIGASWSSVSPDLGTFAIVERFEQLAPRLLFADLQYRLNGAVTTIDNRINELVAAVDSLQEIILLSPSDSTVNCEIPVHSFATAVATTPLSLHDLTDFPFDHPLFILFSSGTTGAPKCIVHGAGGTLIEHVKEHRLHSGLTENDTLLFQTSTGWMMWNWQLSALAGGTSVVLYNGSVSYPEKWQLLKVLIDHNVTVFGTSPAYIQYLIESGMQPNKQFCFAALRAIQSTGSVLYGPQFEWITNNIKPVPVQSVSGGTDMIGCLVLGHPDLPVRAGDSQCISLGIDVQVKSGAGVTVSGSGELVVVKPFP